MKAFDRTIFHCLFWLLAIVIWCHGNMTLQDFLSYMGVFYMGVSAGIGLLGKDWKNEKCSGKPTFSNLEDAMEFSILKSARTGKELTPYPCKRCGRIHVGRRLNVPKD